LAISGTNYTYIFDQFDGTIPDLQMWFKVSALVKDEQGLDSNLAGPIFDCASCMADEPGLVIATPGLNQVFLEWQQPANATVYDIQYTNNTDTTNWTLAATNVNDTRFWHTNLVNGTKYSYQITPKTLFAYTNNDAYDVYVAGSNSAVVSATPETNFGPTANVTVAVAADAYDGMVNVHWQLTSNSTPYQCFVERKLQSDPDTAYGVMSVTGYGLDFLDSSVVDGTTYEYRVTQRLTRTIIAFKQRQARHPVPPDF
jgi:hypothetical protein